MLPFVTTVAMAAVVQAGCGTGDDGSDPVVARAYEEMLHWSDLRQVIPMGSTAEDSAAMAQRFITNWLRQQVLLHQAGQNIAEPRLDLERQVQEYRNSLIIYAYEQALVDQKLDTLVSEAEIEEHYIRNRDDLALQEDMYRLRWFKVRDEGAKPGDRRTVERLKGHFLSGSSDRMREVEVWLAERGIPITDRSTGWTPLSVLVAELPMEDVPVVGRSVVRSGDATSFIDILEHRPKDSAAPLELVRTDIRSIIINQRKLQLIERMREDLYRDAIARKDIEVL
jgi:hypothetical protein